jgi:hypothetical protein
MAKPVPRKSKTPDTFLALYSARVSAKCRFAKLSPGLLADMAA